MQSPLKFSKFCGNFCDVQIKLGIDAKKFEVILKLYKKLSIHTDVEFNSYYCLTIDLSIFLTDPHFLQKNIEFLSKAALHCQHLKASLYGL